MEDHPVPIPLVKLVVADLVSRVAEFGVDEIESAQKAIDVLRRLPRIHPDTELRIEWSRTHPPPASAGLELSVARLELTVGDEASSGQPVYCCDARFDPEMDRNDLDGWIRYFKCLEDASIDISVYDPIE